MMIEILNKMSEVVANTMTSFQSDFEKYDKEYITREGVNAFLFCGWFIGHTLILFVCRKSGRITLIMKRFGTILHRVVVGFMLIYGQQA